MTGVRTPRLLERKLGHRYSLHLFRWGWHVKIRHHTHFRHLIVKAVKGYAYGGPNRRMVYVGWWESYKGTRQHLNGFRLVIGCDKLPPYPKEKHKVPIYPRKTRDRERPFEVH